MILLLLGTLLTWSAFAAVGNTCHPDGQSGVETVMLVIIATSIAWAVAELTNIVSPLRLLDPRVHAPRRLILTGIKIGTLGVLFTLLSLPLVDQFVEDELTVGAAATLASFIVLVLQARVHPDHCIHCDYARTQLSPSAPCPECGMPAPMLSARRMCEHAQAVTVPAMRE